MGFNVPLDVYGGAQIAKPVNHSACIPNESHALPASASE